MEEDVQKRIERLERTVNALRSSLLNLYHNTEDLAVENIKPSHLQNFESISRGIEHNRETLESLN